MAMATNKDLPRLRLNSTDDFAFAGQWESTFGTTELSRGQSRIDGVENVVEDVVSTAQKQYNYVNEFYNANVDTIKSAVDIVSKNVDLKGLENVFHSFQQSAGVLVKGLDELGKLHPFIAVAVIPFKLVYVLDSGRRDNNKKVMAIKVQMKEMMLALFQLRHVRDSDETGPDGTSIAGRMQSLMKTIAEEIKACGSACDAYLKKSFLAKTFKSKFYEPTLASYGDLFVKRKDEIHFALTVHTAVGVDNANLKLDSVNDHMKTVEEKIDTLLLFRKLDTPRELDLHKFIEDNGGIKACIDNDKLLMDLMKKDDSTRQPSIKEARKQLNKELSEDVEQALKKNFEVFGRKLEAQSRQIDTINDTIHDQGEHIISVIMSGSHDHILDKDLQRIWMIGAWKGSVKARHFVLTLYDYYSEHQDEIVESSVASPTGSVAFPHSPLGEPTSAAPSLYIAGNLAVKAARLKHHRWALSYVNVSHLQPIIEAIDDDGTGFVTIKEVNTFATSRPEGWSLLHWLAYWSSGWHLSLTQYYSKIHSLFRQLFTAHKYVLPANKLIVTAFLDNDAIKKIELLLRSMQLREETNVKKDAEEQLAVLVEGYAKQEEKRMEDVLQTIAYNIDTQSTVSLITGPGRIERLLFPLLHLLLKQYLKIIVLGSVRVLDSDALTAPLTSLENVLSIVDERIAGLNAIFKQTSSDVKSRFSNFAYAMFALTHEGVKRDPRNTTTGRPPPDSDDYETVEDPDMLEDSFDAHVAKAHTLDASMLKQSKDYLSEIEADEVDRAIKTVYTLPMSPDDNDSAESQSPLPSHSDDDPTPHTELQGIWTTSLTYWSGPYLWTWLSTIQIGIKFADPASGDYTISGVGQSLYGDYEVTGRYFPASQRIAIMMKYKPNPEIRRPLIRGTVDFENGIINGNWMAADHDQADLNSYLDEEDKLLDHLPNQFLTFVRTPAHLYHFRTTPNRGVLSLARSRWSFALGAALNEAQKKLWSWRYIKSYCIFRRRYLKWRIQVTTDYLKTVKYSESMKHPQPLWDNRRLRPDVSPSDAQFYLQAYLGAQNSDPYAAQDRLRDLQKQAAEKCSPALLPWCQVWCGHLYFYQLTGELERWQGLVQFVLSEFDEESEAAAGVVSVKGEGQSQYGPVVISGRYQISDQSMTVNFRFANLSSLEAVMRYSEEIDALTGSWKVLPGVGDVSSITTKPVVGYFATKTSLLFTRTDASVFRYRPPPDSSQYHPVVVQERNLPRLRWSFATKAVLHQVRQRLWSWNHFLERAVERMRFVDRQKKERMGSHSAFNILDRAWNGNTDHLLWTTVPADGHFFFGTVTMELKALEYHDGYGCDVCDGTILTTRLFCLTCVSDDFLDEMDVCETCVDKSGARDSFKHEPSHPLLKCTDYMYDHQYAWAVEHGREVWERVKKTFLDGSKEGANSTMTPDDASMVAQAPMVGSASSSEKPPEKPSPTCTFCSANIELPFWVCVECASDVYVCPSCALRNPMTLKKSVSTTHSTGHMLVRVYSDSNEKQPEDAEAHEEKEEEEEDRRLDAFETKLATIQTDLNDLRGNIQPRLEKLEASMERIEMLLSKLATRLGD